ncbi:hypothetical protein MSG28_005533 [Choristoneura fumiferana]|uniref:Uncharacterized protein n=1 Tax=Choristoneura fumiferana TaxID=7141 RepID=A0ACC0KZR4_CHOFU|nr:hypothetical protein MSG28_005533 [Choristoneura fumiferana]
MRGGTKVGENYFGIESKRAAYGDDEDNPPTPSDDSDFDDDEDPDNLEVPGGGKTLAAAAQLGSKPKGTPAPATVTVRATTNPLAAPSGVAFGQSANVKPIKISANTLSKPINLGLSRGGGVAAPSPYAAGSSAAYSAALLAQTVHPLELAEALRLRTGCQRAAGERFLCSLRVLPVDHWKTYAAPLPPCVQSAP